MPNLGSIDGVFDLPLGVMEEASGRRKAQLEYAFEDLTLFGGVDMLSLDDCLPVGTSSFDEGAVRGKAKVSYLNPRPPTERPERMIRSLAMTASKTFNLLKMSRWSRIPLAVS